MTSLPLVTRTRQNNKILPKKSQFDRHETQPPRKSKSDWIRGTSLKQTITFKRNSQTFHWLCIAKFHSRFFSFANPTIPWDRSTSFLLTIVIQWGNVPEGTFLQVIVVGTSITFTLKNSEKKLFNIKFKFTRESFITILVMVLGTNTITTFGILVM